MHLFYQFAAGMPVGVGSMLDARPRAPVSTAEIAAAFAAQIGFSNADPVAIGFTAMRAFLARLNDPRGGAGNEYAGHQDTAQCRCRKTEQVGERQHRQTEAGKPEGVRIPLLVRLWIHGSRLAC